MKKCLVCVLVLQMLLLTPAIAQDGGEPDFVKNTQDDIILVGAAGAGGAVIGLSTLSFYDNSSQHVSNIWTGAAIGVIIGVLFVAFNSAQKNSEELVTQKDFETSHRSKWHKENDNLLSLQTVEFGTSIWQTTF